MKQRFKILILIAAAGFAPQAVPKAHAQGTAFTYQGVLGQGGNAVNGSADLTFTLYDAASGGDTVGTSNVVSDLVLSNGLFTVTLDFGAGAFNGAARWLQIAARPGASTGGYTNLAPRTPITATPYAIYAASAATAGNVSSLAASNITGTIDDGSLSANVARLNVGNTFSESQTIRTSAGGLVISSSTGGQFGSGTLRVQGNTGLGTDPRPDHRLAVAGTVIAGGFVGNGSELANVNAVTADLATSAANFTGPVADSQLSANVALRAGGNIFSGNQSFTSGNVGIGTATPNNLLDVAAGGVIGNSTLMGADQHDVLNRGSKVSFGYNILGSEFLGMRTVVNPSTTFCGNSGDLLFYTWECQTALSREVMRINGRGNVVASGNILASGNIVASNHVLTIGNVGIGQNNPGFPLTFATALGDKIALFNNVGGQPSFGFGIQNSLLQIHTADAGSDVAFGYGTSAAMTETMRVTGDGNVGIGTADPMATIGYPSGWRGLHIRSPGDNGLQIIQGADSARLHLRTDNNITNFAQDFIIANGDNRVDFHWLGGGLGGRLLAMTITTNGNIGIGTTTPSSKLEVAGEVTTTAVNITSDRNAKEQFTPVNAREVLDKVARLPISEWQYKTQSDARHIGPMAQDFRAAFGVGRDEKHITSVDADGVALAAIQGLNEVVREQRAAIEKLEARNQELEERLVGRLAALEKLLEGSPRSEQP
ncbi:MAG: tail fiber domain-containing protein [Verrucomicrobia bacterium]|nr:tail fiber domain-containing protein [Verrucomicrobiota bacterium]